MPIATPALLVVVLLLGTPASHAQAASVQALLEKYNFLGTFATNCSKPAARTNFYVVRRPLDAGRIQSDIMVGPTERLRAASGDFLFV